MNLSQTINLTSMVEEKKGGLDPTLFPPNFAPTMTLAQLMRSDSNTKGLVTPRIEPALISPLSATATVAATHRRERSNMFANAANSTINSARNP